MIDKKILQKKGALLGCLLGVLMIVLTIFPIYYFVSSHSFWMVMIGGVVTMFMIPLICAVLFAFKLRSSVGGYWDFREAVTGIFIMLLIAASISSVANFVFEKYIEPGISEQYFRNMQNNIINYMEGVGATDEEIDAQVAKLDVEIEAKNNATVMTVLGGFCVYVIIVFVVALALGAVLKREKPIFNIVDSDPTV